MNEIPSSLMPTITDGQAASVVTHAPGASPAGDRPGDAGEVAAAMHALAPRRRLVRRVQPGRQAYRRGLLVER